MTQPRIFAIVLVFTASAVWYDEAGANGAVGKSLDQFKGSELCGNYEPRDSEKYKATIDRLETLVVALGDSLIESRSMLKTMESRLETLESIVSDIAPDTPPGIFFTVHNEGVKAYSWATNDAVLVKSTAGYNNGLAYDLIRGKLYWSSSGVIYKGNRDDDIVEVVFDSIRYGVIRGLSFDWLTTNLYGVTQNGVVFACNTMAIEIFDCISLLTGRGDLYQIAVNPNDGMIYWTNWAGAIWQAEMDGSNSRLLVSGLAGPTGITIDYVTSRLYWTNHSNHTIQSSNLQGKDIRTVTVATVSGASPWAIATLQDRIFWGTYGSSSLHSVTKVGEDVRTLYDGVNQVHQLAVATSDLPRNRTNDCERWDCSRICVLTATHARCLE